MKKVLSTLIVLVISLVVGTCVIARTGTIQTNSLNVREKASTESESIGVLDKNQKVNVISKENDWYKIQYNSEEGYVKGDYVAVDDEDTSIGSEYSEKNAETISSDVSNKDRVELETKVDLYILPLISSTKLGVIDEGTEIITISNNGRWLYVKAGSRKGWIISNKIDTLDTGAGNEEEVIEENVVENEVTEENNTVEQNVTNEVVENLVEENKTIEGDSGKYPVTMYVLGDSVNIRSSASITASVISGVSKNMAVKVIAKEGDWYKVDTEDGIGYIKSDLLTSSKN